MDDDEKERRRFWAKVAPFASVDDLEAAGSLEHIRRRSEAREKAALLASTMREARGTPGRLTRHIELVRTLHAAGRITWAEYVCHIGSRLEGVNDERARQGDYAADLDPIQTAMEAIERREGLARGEYWARDDEPADYRRLNQAYEAVLDDKLIAVAREFGEDALARLLAQDRPEYDRLREAGRRSVFEVENQAAALRTTIDVYEAEAKRSAAGGAPLAASVMLAAAAEARLLLRCIMNPADAASAAAALAADVRPRKADPSAWTLEQLIAVAAQAGWIVPLEGEDYVVFVDRMVQQLRLTRNLVHPGRYIREHPHLALDDAIYLDAEAAYTILRLSEAEAQTAPDEAVARSHPHDDP